MEWSYAWIAACVCACLAASWRLAPSIGMFCSYAYLRLMKTNTPSKLSKKSAAALKVMRPPRLEKPTHFVPMQQDGLHARVPRPGAGDYPET